MQASLRFIVGISRLNRAIAHRPLIGAGFFQSYAVHRNCLFVCHIDTELGQMNAVGVRFEIVYSSGEIFVYCLHLRARKFPLTESQRSSIYGLTNIFLDFCLREGRRNQIASLH